MIAPRLDEGRARPAVHGGPAGRGDLGCPEVVLDFSTNVNAWGPAPVVLEALAACDPAAYPDPDARLPRAAAAALWGLDLERVSFGAGAVDLIDRLCRAYLTTGDRALVVAPAFGEYARAVRMTGAEVIELRSDARADPDPRDVVRAIEKVRPRLAFLASPSSPLGSVFPLGGLNAAADAVGPYGLLGLDESFRSFGEERVAGPTLPERREVVHLRSLTKDCALAGLRAALLIADEKVCRAVESAGVPWSASTPAQVAAAAALSSAGLAHVEASLRRLSLERPVMQAELAALGLPFRPSVTNYFCVHAAGAAELAARLRRIGVRVRDASSFGLQDHLRVAVRSPPENRRLAQAIHEVGWAR